ncbi:MAG TPA: PqiC family protein [Usitatibacter sp.]|nr:PqiC family protein [Usitatibacter sp.]
MRSLVRLAALAAALSLAACVGAPAPRERFFTLGSPEAGAPPASAAPSIFVGRVSIPAAVDRTEMVLSTGANQVDISDDDRWAEPLRDAIPRVIAQDLSRDLGTSRVLSSRAAAGTPVDFRVSIEVQRFDSSLADGATVDALWTVTPARGGARDGRTLAHETNAAHDPGALAAAHSRALARVASDIANAIRAMETSQRR